MSPTQKLFQKLLPAKWFQAIQAESENWLLRCPTCNSTRSYWDIGGLRYKGKSVGKRTGVYCDQCGKFRMMTVERRAVE